MMTAVRRLILPTMVLAPALALAVAQPSPEAHAWRPDPLATGALAVHAGDHVATGRVASVSGKEMILENDFGGNEHLVLSDALAKDPGLHPGALVTVSYHMEGQDRRVDRLVPGDATVASAGTSAASAGTGSGSAK